MCGEVVVKQAQLKMGGCSVSIWIAMSIGTALMFVIMLIAGRYLKTDAWKTAVLSVVLAGAGYGGAKLMYMIEAGGSTAGRSFFGALLWNGEA